jgi:two-component system, NarL family, response regulator LiaR
MAVTVPRLVDDPRPIVDPWPSGQMRGAVRLLIVDNAPTRAGIRMALGGDVVICAEESEPERAVRAAKRERPDVALIAREITGDWRAAVRGVRRAAPACAVVVLAQRSDVDDMIDSVRAGAVGYVPGPIDAERLHRILQAASGSEAVLPRALVHELLAELRDGHSPDSELSGREAQVLGMLRRGHTTATIAVRLRIAPVTVRRHISELVHKLGVESRADLIDPVRAS